MYVSSDVAAHLITVLSIQDICLDDLPVDAEDGLIGYRGLRFPLIRSHRAHRPRRS
jgi:hypothetical protein